MIITFDMSHSIYICIISYHDDDDDDDDDAEDADVQGGIIGESNSWLKAISSSRRT